jgi:hypothetical protein
MSNSSPSRRAKVLLPAPPDPITKTFFIFF